MNRFYLSIKLVNDNDDEYEDIVFVGVSFKEQKGVTVKNTKKRYVWNEDGSYTL